MTVKLYDYPLSGNYFKVRQMLARTHPGGLFTPAKGAIAHTLISTWVENGI